MPAPSESTPTGRSRKGWLWAILALLAVALIVTGLWVSMKIQPVGGSESRLVRFNQAIPLSTALSRLEREGVLRDARAVRVYAFFVRSGGQVQRGTYEFSPADGGPGILRTLSRPMRRMVRIPETNWASRTARLLEKENVCSAAEYLGMVHHPQRFAKLVDFPLPEDTLEGFLYPDTYDLPPLTPAEDVVAMQLRNFDRRVWRGLHPTGDLRRLLTIASLVEMEVARDEERPMVAGVIENRLRKGMRLQIDAAINYGIQKWRRLTYNDYRNVKSPYNLYRVGGLPPTPICSPTTKSIAAAMNPATHNYLYYVALPSGQSLFSATYDEHLQNVARRRREMAKS